MRIPASFKESDIRDAHDAADVVASDQFRPYLTGRLLPMLVARFRDDAAEALRLEPRPALPRRGEVRAASLDELTSTELVTLWGAVDALVERFTRCMDDPELPGLLASLREQLAAERAERKEIAESFAPGARAS
jgi:hypothetical protein